MKHHEQINSDVKSVEIPQHIMSQALEQTADIVLVTDHRGIIKYVNSSFETTTGYSKKEVIGRKPSIIRSGLHGPDFYQKLWQTISNKKVFRNVVVNRCKNGQKYYEEKTITPLIDELGNITHYISTGRDVSSRIKTEKKLHHLAFFDQLTGLPNRLQVNQYLNEVISQAERRDEILAILFLDLNRFKDINDTLGHDEGDNVLKEVGVRLRNSVRQEDMVARSGGDEFIILLRDIKNENDVAHIAEKIICKFDQPFKVGNIDQILGVSIGISLFPNDYITVKDLLKCADMAMYQAKGNGISQYKFFSIDMEERVQARFELERDLKRAISKDEFINYYQPQYDLDSGELTGAEALIRWQHPQKGLIGPNEFITIAEDTGDILTLGNSALRNSCAQYVRWKSLGIKTPQISVNLSPYQVNQNTFNEVAELIKEMELKEGELTLELTESALMLSPDQAVKILFDLKTLGVKLSIDDFGTGYSSLSYLQRFPLDYLKIDRSFIHDIPENKESASLVTAIISMAHTLNMKVIAEGVETESQIGFLRNLGCDGVQGYLLGKPMPDIEFKNHPRHIRNILNNYKQF